MKKSKFDSKESAGERELNEARSENYSAEIDSYVKQNFEYIQRNGIDYNKVIKDLEATEDIDKEFIINFLAEAIATRNETTKIINKPEKAWKHNLSDDLIEYYTKKWHEEGGPEWARSMQPQSEKSGCFIATVVYGSPNSPEVRFLRRYRDDTLSKSMFGRFFIKKYYTYSPNIANCLKPLSFIKILLKMIINTFIKIKNFKRFNDA